MTVDSSMTSTIQPDWIYSYQQAFLYRQVLQAQATLLGHSIRPGFDWVYLGLELAAGRWAGYLNDDTTSLLLERISAIAGIKKLPASQTSCLFTYVRCVRKPYTHDTPSSPDSIMDFSLQGDTLILTTTSQQFEVPISHNPLRGVQGGNAPTELYHLDKDTYDKIQALFYTPATGSISVQPALVEIGTSVLPTLSGFATAHDDTITQLILRRGTTIIYIGSNNPFPFSDSEQTASVTYVLEIVRDGKSTLTYVAALTTLYPIYIGAINDIPTPTQVHTFTKLLQPKGMLDVRLTTTVSDM